MSYSTLYSTPQNVVSVLSAEGIRLAQDDDQSGGIEASEIEFITDAMEHAQSKINFYTHLWYDMATVPGNTWIRWCHAVLSACQLMRRRGGSPPDGLIQQELEYYEALDEVKNNRAKIPPDGDSDMKLRATGAGMTMSNLRVDHRYHHTKVRYVPRISTGPQGSPDGIPRFSDSQNSYLP